MEQNRAQNEARAAELAKRQELKRLADKEKSKPTLDINKTTSESRGGSSGTGQS